MTRQLRSRFLGFAGATLILSAAVSRAQAPPVGIVPAAGQVEALDPAAPGGEPRLVFVRAFGRFVPTRTVLRLENPADAPLRIDARDATEPFVAHQPKGDRPPDWNFDEIRQRVVAELPPRSAWTFEADL
jgi:hypothetical protein